MRVLFEILLGSKLTGPNRFDDCRFRFSVHACAVFYAGGESSLWNTSSDDLMHLGVGVTLYFKIVKYFALIMGIGTLFYLPLVILFSSGDRVPTSAPDPFKFSRISLGNIGYVVPIACMRFHVLLSMIPFHFPFIVADPRYQTRLVPVGPASAFSFYPAATRKRLCLAPTPPSQASQRSLGLP